MDETHVDGGFQVTIGAGPHATGTHTRATHAVASRSAGGLAMYRLHPSERTDGLDSWSAGSALSRSSTSASVSWRLTDRGTREALHAAHVALPARDAGGRAARQGRKCEGGWQLVR